MRTVKLFFLLLIILVLNLVLWQRSLATAKSTANYEVIFSPPQDSIKRFFEYQARGKESIYQIAIRYQASVDNIYLLNPGIGDQLRNEQIIKIPLSPVRKSFITHTIRKRQTVNRLAKMYKLSVNEIRAINPYLSRHLLPGQVVKIPLLYMDKEKIALIDSINLIEPGILNENYISEKEFCYNLNESGEYKIALMLPLYFDVLDSLKTENIENPDQEIFHDFIKPFTFIQFYEGFMMAVDSLQKAGLDARIFVFDVDEDVQKTKLLVRNPNLRNMDLIIGPVYSESFFVISGFANENKIPIVNPFSTREEILYDNPWVYKIKPSVNSQFEELVRYLNEHHPNSQIFIARHNPYQESLRYERLKSELNKNLNIRPVLFADLYKEILYSRDSVNTLIRDASTEHENVIITLSDRTVFVLDFLRKINELRDTFQLTVIGIPQWKQLRDLELEYLNNLNTHIFAENFVDYNNPEVKYFVEKFREKFKTEPQDFAFEGYDIGIFFLSALQKYGKHFNDCIPYYKKDLLHTSFDFESQPCDGFENIYWKVLSIWNYRYFDVSRKFSTFNVNPPPGKYYKFMD